MAKKAKKPKPTGIDAQLREAVEASGITGYALAKASGVPQSVIVKFGQGVDVRLSTAAKIARVLGLELRSPK